MTLYDSTADMSKACSASPRRYDAVWATKRSLEAEYWPYFLRRECQLMNGLRKCVGKSHLITSADTACPYLN